MATAEMVVAGEVEQGLIRHEASGVMALSLMSETEFQARLDAMKRGQDRVRVIQRELMVGPTKEDPEGVDFGVIPGTKKPTLLKPGAEKLCNVYGLVPTFEETWIEGDGITAPHLRVRIKCYLHRGDADGPVVGEGVGAANSWERKHRYRGGQRACPSCGCAGTIRRSSFERNGDKGWYCHDKAGGCGATFHSTDQAITEQQAGQVENPDPFDVENTLLKMAKKRAHVDGTLTATATSGLFSQDVEDLPHEAPKPAPRPAQQQAAQPEREPGDEEGPDQYEDAGVPPPAAPRPAPAQSRQAGGAAPCPKCGKLAQPSKFPKEGKTHYCYHDRFPFEPRA